MALGESFLGPAVLPWLEPFKSNLLSIFVSVGKTLPMTTKRTCKIAALISYSMHLQDSHSAFLRDFFAIHENGRKSCHSGGVSLRTFAGDGAHQPEYAALKQARS